MKLKTNVRVIVIGLVFLSLSLVFAVLAVDATDVVVNVNPASQTVVNPGESFSVNVSVESVTYMAAEQATLNFDPGAMNVTGVTEGDFMKGAGATFGAGFETIDNANGYVTFFYVLTTPGIGTTGSGTLATINFDTAASAEGIYDLELTDVLLGDGDSNEITVDAIINGTVTIGNPPNQPPSTPSKPSGQTSGQIGLSYSYSTATTDPDGDNVYYWFDWGDSTNSGWIGPYSSGASGSASKAWSSPAIYDVKAKAKDVRGAYSSPLWSDPLPVCINGLWEDDPSNSCKERRLACSGTYEYRNKSDGTYCGCTANNTMKKCCGGTCSDTGICNSTYCGADSACDGKKPGDTCDADKNCNLSCKCITPNLDVTTVSTGNRSAEYNDTAVIAIMINVSSADAPSGLGNATINLTYNPEVVNVISVKNSSFDSFVYNTNNSSGLTRIVAYQTGATGPTGDVKFADIEFKAVGEGGDVSPLNLEVIELSDNNGGPIPHVVKNGSFTILDEELNPFDTGSPENPYPSIGGIHNGTIKPNTTIRVHKLYTYPCPGTGGHTEYVKIENNSGWNVTARWEGYNGDWHNITFEESFTLQPGVEYNYTLVTGSYPQIIHQHEANVTGGAITCTKFVDANGKIYKDYIPAIILS